MKKYILLLTIAITLILGSCNSEGNGIFFQISQEVKQISSEISDLAVHQVVEVDGKVYARTGRKVWEQNGTAWTDVSDGNFIYNIVEYDDGTSNLYGNINNDDVNLADCKIMKYSSGSWTEVDSYNANLTLFEADDNYILVNGTDVSYSTTDVSSINFDSNNTSSNLILDGASGTEDLLISSNKIYGTAFTGNLTEQADPASFSGTYTGLATTGSNLYISTSSGQIFYGTTASWTLVGTSTGDTPVAGSLEVVTISGIVYLIIGTNNGYYEMNITSSGDVTKPTAATSVLDFDTSYPELATELVFEVYPSSVANTFYLATGKGLWKRKADGTFEKQ